MIIKSTQTIKLIHFKKQTCLPRYFSMRIKCLFLNQREIFHISLLVTITAYDNVVNCVPLHRDINVYLRVKYLSY